MANEIQVQTTVQYAKNRLTLKGATSFGITNSGSGYGTGQTVSTDYIAIETGSLNSVRYLYLENTNTQSIVTVSNTNSDDGAWCYLSGSECASCYPVSKSLYMKATEDSTVNVILGEK